MATPIAYPFVNGVRQSFVSTEIRFTSPAVGTTQQGTALALSLRGYTSIEYSRDRERTTVYGNHPDPIGKTKGKNTYKASAEFFLSEWKAIKDAIKALGSGAGYGDVAFDIVVTHSENGTDTQTDSIIGCTLDSTENASAEGTEATKRKINFNPLKVILDKDDDTTPM